MARRDSQRRHEPTPTEDPPAEDDDAHLQERTETEETTKANTSHQAAAAQ